jgi:hypothetical protein
MMTPGKPKTAMGAAFAAAGYEPPEMLAERLRRLMREAGSRSGWQADPSIDAFIRALVAEDDAAALIWELVAEVRMSAIRRLFGIAFHEAKAAQSAARREGQAPNVTQNGPADATRPGSHRGFDTQHDAASGPLRDAAAELTAKPPVLPTPAPPVAPSPQHQRAQHERASARLEMAPRSYLDMEVINGKPVGDLTLAEARGAALARSRNARFIQNLISRLPENARRIRDHLTAQDALECFLLAQQDEAA